MLGTFDNDQPKIEIEVKGIGSSKKLVGLIDSGFNGYLTIPFIEAFPLGLVLIGIQSSTIADGSPSYHLVCMGEVCIDGKWIHTTIDIQPANIILIGTKLLKELNKTFVLDCSKSKVEIIDSADDAIKKKEQ